jgi:F-actin capping protein alpha subunit
LKKAIPAKFKDANVLVLGFTKGLQMTLDITIVANAINMKNKFTGEWISTWQFVWEKDSAVGKLSGEIKVVGHFFEEGNIQRKVSQKHKEEEIKIEGGIAKKILEYIDSDDTKIRAALEDMEGEFTEELLKKIRRKLPGK